MILLRNIRLPKITGITLWPFILVRPKEPSVKLINHERIHLRQQLELLVVFFYVWYVLEWGFHFMRVRSWWGAYYLISFEREAYANEANLEYLADRPLWAFWRYR